MIALLLIFSVVPQSPFVTDHVDLIEVNHLHDANGRRVLDQVIFWQWDFAYSRHQVVAWRIYKAPEQFPKRCWRTDRFVTRWRDQATWREVISDQCYETWTTFDPEVEERSILAIERRRELTTQPQTARPAGQ